MKIQHLLTAAMVASLMAGGNAFAQSHTVTASSFVPSGAAVSMAQMKNMAANAGGYGTNVQTFANSSLFKSDGFKSLSVSSSAFADQGGVMAGASTSLGTVSSGASGSGIGAWSSGFKSVDPTAGTYKSLSTGASAANGGAWTAIQGSWGSAVSVGAGTNVQVNSGYSISPVTWGGGKG